MFTASHSTPESLHLLKQFFNMFDGTDELDELILKASNNNIIINKNETEKIVTKKLFKKRYYITATLIAAILSGVIGYKVGKHR